MIPPMSQHTAAANNQFMYVLYEDKVYRYDINNQVWHRLKKSLKAPKMRGQCTMQLLDNYLYLFGSNEEGTQLFRLNLEKAWLWLPGDNTGDYSVSFT